MTKLLILGLLFMPGVYLVIRGVNGLRRNAIEIDLRNGYARWFIKWPRYHILLDQQARPVSIAYIVTGLIVTVAILLAILFTETLLLGCLVGGLAVLSLTIYTYVMYYRADRELRGE